MTSAPPLVSPRLAILPLFRIQRGGHTPLNWRGTLADGLLSLLGRERSSTHP